MNKVIVILHLIFYVQFVFSSEEMTKKIKQDPFSTAFYNGDWESCRKLFILDGDPLELGQLINYVEDNPEYDFDLEEKKAIELRNVIKERKIDKKLEMFIPKGIYVVITPNGKCYTGMNLEKLIYKVESISKSVTFYFQSGIISKLR